jgi:hypothetical protein
LQGGRSREQGSKKKSEMEVCRSTEEMEMTKKDKKGR